MRNTGAYGCGRHGKRGTHAGLCVECGHGGRQAAMRAAAGDAATRAAAGMRTVTTRARPGATIASSNDNVRRQCIVLHVLARHRTAQGKQREQTDEKEAIDDWHVERSWG